MRPMQGYRQAPPPVSLITYIGGRIVALDPQTGALRWERDIEPSVARIAVTPNVIFLASNETVTTLMMLDAATGADRGSMQLDFSVAAALTTSDRVFFSSRGGLVAFTLDGELVFQIRGEVTMKSSWSGNKYDLVGQDSSKREMFRIKDLVHNASGPSFLAFGAQVAQVDFDT